MLRTIMMILLFFPLSGRGDDEFDPKETRDLASVESLMHQVGLRHPGGRVLKVELEREDDEVELIYEVKVLTSDGGVVKLAYRARDLVLLKEQRPRVPSHDDD